MRILVLCASIILTLFITPAGFTQHHEASDACANAEQGLELSNCIAEEYERADAELNKVYRQVISKIHADGHKSKGHKAALENAQRAWIKYRDANCEYESYLYREGAPMEQHREVCMTRMSVEKTKELRKILEDNLRD